MTKEECFCSGEEKKGDGSMLAPANTTSFSAFYI
jgi:hypothetical protein